MQEKLENKAKLRNPFRNFKTRNMIYPILIGLIIVSFMLYKELNIDKIQIKGDNFKTSKNWADIEYNGNIDTAKVTINDTLISNLDTLKFTIEYLVKLKKRINACKDTIILCNNILVTHANKFNKIVVERRNQSELYFYSQNSFKSTFSLLRFSSRSVIFVFLALLMIVFRDIGFAIRIMILTKLKFRQALKIIYLWEFGSSMMPSVVGGVGAAIYLLNKEGLSVGKSSTIVMSVIFFDHIYQSFAITVLFIVFGSALFYVPEQSVSLLSNEFFYFALISYFIIVFYTLFLIYGIFINPRGLKWLLLRFFKIRFIRKWRFAAHKMGSDLVEASKELKHKTYKFWIKILAVTFFSWTSRFLIVNFLLLAFTGNENQFLLFSRQVVMQVMMLVSPTPGGSGFAEYIFKEYLGEFIPSVGFAVILALIWRLITYYPYLFIGSFLLPRWIRQKFKH